MSLRQETSRVAAAQRTAAEAEEHEKQQILLAQRADRVAAVFAPVAGPDEIIHVDEIVLRVLVKRYARHSFTNSTYMELIDVPGSHFRVDDVDVFVSAEDRYVQPLVTCSTCSTLTNARGGDTEADINSTTTGQQANVIHVNKDDPDPEGTRRNGLIARLAEVHGEAWTCGPCKSRAIGATCQACHRTWS